MKRLLLLLITGYQKLISPLKPGCCRFTPTCSSYMMQAVGRFGVWKGTLLGICRILRCNPFFAGGFDPVPFCFTLSGRQLPRVPLKIRSASPSGKKPF